MRNLPELKKLLEENYLKYNNPSFIEKDPVSIPHLFTSREDIEISGFLTSIISWGYRPSILKDAHRMIGMMDHSPADFVLNASAEEINRMEKFYHRTFNGTDAVFFIIALRNIYKKYGGLENCFSGDILKETISSFKIKFLETVHPKRSEKHLADPLKGSAAKRILMFLRWMVRDDGRGVDFGLWKNISPSSLYIPLDVHSGNMARKIGILKRPANDWKAVEELTAVLRLLDPDDPAKYDFALFGPLE